MFKKFYPFEYVESVFTIDYNKLYKNGYKGIIFDIDNTLVHHGDDSNEKVDNLFKNIQNIGFQTLLLSDNDEKRVKRFIKNIDSLYICDAQKPNTANYLKALEMMNLNKTEVVYIGDQIFKDILGANRSEIPCVLVKYIRLKEEKKIGIKRNLEKIILSFYKRNKHFQNRLGGIEISKEENFTMEQKQSKIKKNIKNKDIKENKKRNFCDINPICYNISWKKEIFKRYLQDLSSKEKYAKNIIKEELPNVISSHSSNLIKKGKGIDPVLQENKANNIKLACSKIDGMVIHPGEVFSFWKTIGKTTKRKGYKDGRVIIKNKLRPGIGGGLCNLGNTINLLVLHSPLEITEFHNHSDALAPDEGKRVPLSSGTSISYNYIDYRFKNNTDQDVQLHVWCEDGKLCGELRSEKEFPWKYELFEEDHHFQKEEDKYYRVSKIYRNTIEKATGEVIDKKLILDNHSKVMYDYDLIPKEQIRI